MSAYLYRGISPPSTNVRMAHLYRVEIRPGTNVPAFVPVLAPTRYKCGLTRHVGGLPSHPVQMPSFVSGVEILSTNEKSTQGQMPDSLVVSLGTLWIPAHGPLHLSSRYNLYSMCFHLHWVFVNNELMHRKFSSFSATWSEFQFSVLFFIVHFVAPACMLSWLCFQF